MSFLEEPRFWIYLAAWVPYTSFMLLYGFLSPWYRTAVGRSLLLSKSVITLLLTHALLSLLFGRGYSGSGILIAMVIGLVVPAGWLQLILLLRLQRQARTDELVSPTRETA